MVMCVQLGHHYHFSNVLRLHNIWLIYYIFVFLSCGRSSVNVCLSSS